MRRGGGVESIEVNMRSYFLTLFGVALTAALVNVISPEGVMKKHIELICSICVIAAVAVPVIKGIISVDIGNIDIALEEEFETDNYDEIYNQNLLYTNKTAAEQVLKNELARTLDVNADGVGVSLEISQDGENTRIESVKVFIAPEAVSADPQGIKKYVAERLSVECEIIYNLFDEK